MKSGGTLSKETDTRKWGDQGSDRMKYTICGFDQRTLVDMELNLQDAQILRWFIDFQNTSKMVAKEVDGKSYFWVKYSAVIESLPILGFETTKSVARHFTRLCDAGVLDFYLNKTQAGTYTFYRPGESYQSLQETFVGLAEDIPSPCAQDTDSQPKDSSLNKNSSSINTIVSFLNELAGTDYKPTTAATIKALNGRLGEGYTVDDCKAVLKLKWKEWEDTHLQQYFTPTTLFRPSNFEKYYNALRIDNSKDPREAELAKIRKAEDEKYCKKIVDGYRCGLKLYGGKCLECDKGV